MAIPDSLVDSYGRVVRDLRISVTDRCNFRCTYCMPEEGMQWLPRSEVLTFEEIERIARIGVERWGFTGIRLTGGEPTLRANIDDLVRRLHDLDVDVAMTTNGATLDRWASRLADAGLTRINISLDTLQPDRFVEMTRRDDFHRVMAGIAAAKTAGLQPIKLNAVVKRGVNDDEVVALAQYGRDHDLEVRFIEFMPLDGSDQWERGGVVSQDEIVAAINARWPLEQLPARGAAPADRWRYLDGRGTVGVIPSVTRPFCGDCDRIRLTADGQLRTCLFATEETDLRDLMRSGASDSEVAEVIQHAVSAKWAGHQINTVTFRRPERSMSQIGG